MYKPRKFATEECARNWLESVLKESTKKHADIRLAYHDDTEKMVSYIKEVEKSKTIAPWRIDVDIQIGKLNATIGCDILDMSYRFKGRMKCMKPF